MNLQRVNRGDAEERRRLRTFIQTQEHRIPIPDTTRVMEMWKVTGGGGTFNEVTEEVEQQDLLAGVALWDEGYGNIKATIAVAPEHRGRGVGTRLLRALLLSDYPIVQFDVDLRNQAGLAFIAKHGEFVTSNGTVASFEVGPRTTRIPHLGCRCETCREEREMFNMSY